MEHPEKLSDIDLNTHGFTADDVIKDRQARSQAIKEAAIRGNPICAASQELDAIASHYGINSDYDEELDDLDMY